MDLGVQIEPQFGFSYADVLGIAREAETAGFRALWVSDHLFLGADAVATDCLEAWTLLAALAIRSRPRALRRPVSRRPARRAGSGTLS